MTFIEKWHKLPQADMVKCLEAIGYALGWRGWDNLKHRIYGGGRHALEAINTIAAIFEKNGFELEEKT